MFGSGVNVLSSYTLCSLRDMALSTISHTSPFRYGMQGLKQFKHVTPDNNMMGDNGGNYLGSERDDSTMISGKRAVQSLESKWLRISTTNVTSRN